MIGKLASRPPHHVYELLDDAFDLYRSRFLHFAALGAVLYLPAEVLGILVSGEVHAWFLLQQQGQDASTSRLIGIGELLAQNGIFQIPLAFSTVFLGTAVAQSVWQHFHAREPTTNAVLGSVLRRAPRYLLVGLFCGLANLLAFSFFGVGHWFTSVLFVTLPATLQLEGLGFWASLQRIRARQRGNLWFRTLGLLFLTEIVVGMLFWGCQALLAFAFTLVPTPAGIDTANRNLRQYVLTAAAGSLCRYLLAPVSALAGSLLYLDLRIRHEALDLVTAAEETEIPLARVATP